MSSIAPFEIFDPAADCPMAGYMDMAWLPRRRPEQQGAESA